MQNRTLTMFYMHKCCDWLPHRNFRQCYEVPTVHVEEVILQGLIQGVPTPGNCKPALLIKIINFVVMKSGQLREVAIGGGGRDVTREI